MDVGLIQGKHCLVLYKEKKLVNHQLNIIFFKSDLKISSNTEDVLLTGAICLPASCSTNEIITYANELLGKKNLFVPAVINQGYSCHTNNKKPLSIVDFIAM